MTPETMTLHAPTPHPPESSDWRGAFGLARRSAFMLLLGLIFGGNVFGCAPARAGSGGERIIVSGASGQLGGQVVEELLARGVPAERLILVSRTPEELVRYAEMGASTRFGDFTQPESLAEAYAGGDRMLLISISSLDQRPRLHGNAIDAAVAAGVRHIVYTSFVDADRNSSPLAADHRATEALLRESGVAWTMLRNQLYMDGLVSTAARMIADGRAETRPTDQRTGYVARADCAAAAAAVLADPTGHENRAYDITGPEALAPADIARVASAVSGAPIEIVAAAPAAGGPPAQAGGNPSLALVSTAVADLTGRPPLSLRDLLEQNRASLAPRR